MDVKRYDATVEYGPGWDAGASAVMDEAANGDWVEFTDYAAVEAECDRLRAERDAATREAEICKAIIKHCGGSFVVKCMLCGAPYDVRDPDWLKHDLTCPKHPMRDVERERDALARRMVKAVEVLKERCSCDESPALFAITKCKLALLALTTDALESAGLMGKEVPDGK
jgi:hypothetical protein